MMNEVLCDKFIRVGLELDDTVTGDIWILEAQNVSRMELDKLPVSEVTQWSDDKSTVREHRVQAYCSFAACESVTRINCIALV